MADSTREIRAMILASLPYPPLPVRIARVAPDAQVAEGDPAIVTTHTIVAQALRQAAARNDMEANQRRMRRQKEVLQRFLHAMATRGFQFGPRDLYALYTTFSRQHIATYFEEGESFEMPVILPYDYMTLGDASHAKLCEYVAAQSHLFEDTSPIKPEALAHTQLGELLLTIRARLGRMASQEDRERMLDTEEDET